MARILFTLLILLICSVSLAGSEDTFNEHTIRRPDLPSDAPRFEQFQVDRIFSGTPASPDVNSDRESRMFRTNIRNGAKKGPNFAGHYTIVGWGCGSGCTSFAIADAESGKVFHPTYLGAIDDINIDYDGMKGVGSFRYQLNSRLIIVIGGIDEDPKLRGISYFVWENEKLRRIKFIPKPYE